jgi:3-oxoacyl-[acyl-carrier protein] reductase
MLLKDKNILITGASKGIGRSISIELAKQGASLFLLSRDIDALNKLQTEIEEKFSTPVQIFKADIKVQNDLQYVFDTLNQNKNYLDVLINNAGIMLDGSLFTTKNELIKETFETNVYGSIAITKLALKSFIKRKSGSIIFLSSVIGTKGSAGQSIYSASKSALIGLTKSLSKELAPLNIRVNAIAPGFISTDMTTKYNEQQTQKIISTIGLKRAGKPEEIANVALFLSSHLSSYITGQIIEVDGGMII